ncbi:MAG: FkbM family methyltransferase [Sphingomonadales bacterium]
MILSLYRKARGVYRKLIGYPLSSFWVLRSLRRKGLIRALHYGGDAVFFDYGKASQIRARYFPHSDLEVLRQIILYHEYGFAVAWMRDRKLQDQPIRIIDAGANVGYTSLYFLSAFPKALLLAIEPDLDNYNVLQQNLAACKFTSSASALHAALLSRSGIAVSINRQGGDKKDWSFMVAPSQSSTGVSSVSVGDILVRTGWEQIDILKIDIEGSEADVFSEQADLSYLRRTRLVLVEIHDSMADRQLIQRLLSAHGFAIEERSETTFAINKSFV